MRLNLLAGRQKYISTDVSTERPINLYPYSSSANDTKALIMVPGSKTRYTRTGSDRVRALYDNEEMLFAVIDNEVVSLAVALDGTLTATLIGTLNTSVGYVGITENNEKQIVFVDGDSTWVYDYSGMSPSFTNVSPVGFLENPIDCTFLDGHVIIADGNTNRWYISTINNAATYNALNFAAITSQKEFIIGVRVVNRRIFVFGQELSEVFYNSTNASSFPFVRDNNVVLQIGCASAGSISQEENRLVWLSSQGDGYLGVMMTDGGPPKRISSPPLEDAIKNWTSPETTRGYLYRESGLTFYVLNNPADNQTWCYCFEMDSWFEQQMIDESYYFGGTHAFFNGKHYVGSLKEPKVMEVSNNFATNDDERIKCSFTSAIIAHPERQRTRVDRIELEGSQGVGYPTYQVIPTTPVIDFETDPKVYLTISRDRGYVYSGALTRTLGKSGRFDWETVWNTVGVSKDWVFKFETFCGSKIVFTSITIVINPIGY